MVSYIKEYSMFTYTAGCVVLRSTTSNILFEMLKAMNFFKMELFSDNRNAFWSWPKSD